MISSESRSSALPLPLTLRITPAMLAVIFVLTYLPLIERADFRGDDYLIVWNAMLPGVPFFSGTSLVHSGVAKAWFLRPFFRCLAKASFLEFGFHYTAWLIGPVLLVALAAWLGGRVVDTLSGYQHRGIWFMALFFGAFHLHLGSLLWAGEGLMNAPQVFILSASLYCWVVLEGGWTAGAAVALYGLSLLLKESSVFFPLFLWGLPRRRPQQALGWFFALGAVYLVMRLTLVPWNAAYSPTFTWCSLANSGKLLLALAMTPLLLSPHPRAYSRYIPFFVLTIAPCLGHDFFSPGWCLLPGYFLLLVAVLIARKEFLPRATLLATLVSAVLVTFLFSRIRWWQWRGAQVQLRELVESAPDSIDTLVIEQCQPRSLPGPARVLGDEDSVSALWSLVHHRPVVVKFADCSSAISPPATISRKGTLRLRWHFARLD